MFLGLTILVLYVAVVLHWDALTSLKRRVLDLEGRTDTEARDQIAALKRRVAELEASIAPGVTMPPVPLGPPAGLPVVHRPAPVAPAVPQVVLPAPPPAPAGVTPVPVLVPAPVIAAAASVVAPASPIAVVRAPVRTPAPALPVPPSAAASSSTNTTAPERAEGWEVVVGTSWLNKIGVFVFVTGVALLLGYSMAHVGALGRIAIGFALSGGLLGGGVLLERRDTYRNYAYGLIAGGWAGIYFTTFAAHAIPAARVIESDLVATTSLVLVAACMIGHSLRYRSQTVTALAYLAAYGPLASSPLTTFSLVASVPLLVSLVAIATRFGWSAVSVVGLVSSYGLFALRASPVVDAAVDPFTLTPYLVLACYWLAFEAADIVTTRRRRDENTAPLFALNAVGLLGSVLLLLPAGEKGIASAAAAVTAVAFLTTAIVRSRLLPAGSTDQAEAPAPGAFTSVHAAVAVAAALFAMAIDLRSAGPRETALLVFEAELLFVAGVTVADAHIRRLAGALAMVVGLHAVATWVIAATMGSEPTSVWLGPAPVAGLAALVWYVNHEWLRKRSLGADSGEELYPWGALLMIGGVIIRELPDAYHGVAGLGLAAVLVEAGLRRGSGYRYQAYVAGLLAAWAAFAFFALDRDLPSIRQVWMILPAAVAITYATAWRLASGPSHARLRGADTGIAAGAAGCLGTLLVAVFEWQVVPSAFLGLVWATTAGLVLAVGAGVRASALRWQSYALVVAAAVQSVLPLTVRVPGALAEQAAVAGVVALMFAISYAGRQSAEAATDRSLETEISATGLLAVAANLSQALFTWRVVPSEWVAPVWAASALALISIGARRGKPWQRWQGYALALVAMVRAVLPMAVQGVPDAADRLAVAAVIALLYASSYAGRRALRRGTAAASVNEVEDTIVVLLPWFATASVALLERELLATSVPFAWMATAFAILAIGSWRPSANTRSQAYLLFGAGALGTLQAISGPGALGDAAVAYAAGAVGILYLAALAGRLPSLAAARTPAEEPCRTALQIAATLLLALLIADAASRTVVTLAWGLQGALLLAGGFQMRERTFRVSGLALLCLCILKLFVYDLRELEALPRIISFVALGLVLLAVSWIYTRFRDQMRRWL